MNNWKIGERVMIDQWEHEVFEVVGINEEEKTLLLKGDWSAMYNVIQSGWYPMDKTYKTKLVRDLAPTGTR